MSDIKIPPEIEKALEENLGYRNSVRGLQKLTQRFGESARANAEATNAVSVELNKVISDDWVKSAPSLDIAKYFRYFSTTIKAVGCVQEKLAHQVEDQVSGPLANFVDYDFLACAELRKKVSQTQGEYDSTCAKIENAFTAKAKKKSKSSINEQQIQEFEKSLERLRGELDMTTEELAAKQEELSHKKETKVLKYMLQLLVLQCEYHQKAYKLLSNLKPKMDALALQLHEAEEVHTYKEGHLNRKTQAIGSGWQRCFYVLKEGQLYCYKGKKDTQVDQCFNVMLCTTRVDPKKKDSFEIVTPDKKKPVVLQAENQTERDSWVKAINAAISESLNAGSAIGLNRTSRHIPLKKEVTEQKFLRIVSPVPGNQFCVDCGAPDPDWASINLGVLVCLECSGVHRSLGTHITKVRSMTLDTKSWESELLQFMRSVGNERFNSKFEANIPSDVAKPRKNSDRDSRERFIKAKYVEKRFLEFPDHDDKDVLSVELYNKIATTDNDSLDILVLIAAGADVNWRHPQDEEKSPLHAAVIFDKAMYIECLVQNGADIFQTAARKWTPMHYAAYYQRVHCASMLCKHGFTKRQLEFRTDQNKTAVEIAFNSNCQDIISLLRDEPVAGLGITVEELEEIAFQESLTLEGPDEDMLHGSATSSSGLQDSPPPANRTSGTISALDPEALSDDEDLVGFIPSLPPLPTPAATVPAVPPLPVPPAAGAPVPLPLPPGAVPLPVPLPAPIVPGGVPLPAAVPPGGTGLTRSYSLTSGGRPVSVNSMPAVPIPAPLPGGTEATNRGLLYEMRQSSGSNLLQGAPPPVVPLPSANYGGPPPIPNRPRTNTPSTQFIVPPPPISEPPPPVLPPRE